MPAIKGTQSITPIYKGATSIISIYKGTELVYSGSDTAGEYIKPFDIPASYNTNISYYLTSPVTGQPYIFDILETGNYYMIGGGTSDQGYSTSQALIDQTVNDTLETLYIPSTYNGKPVVKLSNFSFYAVDEIYPNLKNIVIGEGIESIGTESFYNVDGVGVADDKKRKIMFPKSLKNICKLAFKNCRIYEVDCSKLTFYGAGQTTSDYTNTVFQYCIIDKALITGDYFELDYAAVGNPAAIFGVTGGNHFKDLKIRNISRLGTNTFLSCTADKISFDSNLVEIAADAFSSGGVYGSIKIPKTISVFGSYSFPLNHATKITFEHTNSDSLTFNLNSSNQGPFYFKTAYNIDVYTDSDYVRNHDWLTNENATVTFYHLDGTAW